MGCTSSTATSKEASSAGGATLLKANTVALDGKPPVPQSGEHAGSTEPTTPAERNNGPWAPFEDESTNGYYRRNCTSKLEQIEQGAVDETPRAKEVRFEPEPEKPCEPSAANFIIEGVLREGEPDMPCEAIKPEEVSAVKEDNTKTCELDRPVEENSAKPCGSNQPAETEVCHNVGKCVSFKASPCKFSKGDFVHIVGPSSNGDLDFKGKNGRIVDVDRVGNIPYEVLVDDETSWFKASSLEKMGAVCVTVTANSQNDNSCCNGRDGLFKCCDATR